MVFVLLGIYFSIVYFDNEKISSETISSQAQQSEKSPSKQEVIIPKEPKEIISASEEDYERLEIILPQNEIIQKLPEKAKIKLSFFNFNSGSREWERTYILTTGNAIQGDASLSEIDMALIIHSRNLPLLNGDNFCEVIKRAQRNGDFAMETEKSTVSLGWKYKRIIGYKDCLGF